MKKVISYSLWGSNPMYLIGALKNAELQQKFYEGWISRYYVDEKVSIQIQQQLVDVGAEVIISKQQHSFDGAFWRFLALADPEVEVAIFRDTDSRLGERERAAVEEWLKSGKDFHIMRDHPLHGAKMLAGMWGCRSDALRNINQLVENWNTFDDKWSDQHFLANVVYPKTTGNVMIHDEFFRFKGESIKPFPTPRNDFEFVGDVFDENERRTPQFKSRLIRHLRNRRGS